ncbi:unannotated protein [freshwater metagenome]|uniref:Unannotated protein n=1 Tax=freshwater metagenome TaxID=449393 RepID=A0A6J7PIP1_9ZZZZ
MSDANSALGLRVNGSSRVIEKFNGRHVICGHTWAPAAQPWRPSSRLRRCEPFGMVSNAV